MTSRAKRKQQRRGGQPDSRQHHYVPAGYIGLFAEPRGRYGKIHVWDKERNRSWLSKPNHVAFVEDLYRLDGEDSPHAIEDALAKAESAMLHAIREIEGKPLSQPTENRAMDVVSFVALQKVRIPEVLGEFQRFASETAGLILEVATATPDRYENQIRKLMAEKPGSKREDFPMYEKFRGGLGNLQFKVNNGFVVQTVLQRQETVFNCLSRFKLGFHWVPGGEELVTASRPVLLVPPRDYPAGLPLGLAHAEAVVMPLTPKLLFIATRRDGRIVASPLAPGFATRTNQALAHQSRQVYSRAPLNFNPVVGP